MGRISRLERGEDLGEWLEQLRCQVILGAKDLRALKNYINIKYPKADGSRKAAILSDALNKVVDTHLEPFQKMQRRQIKAGIFAGLRTDDAFVIDAYDVFEACALLRIKEDDFWEHLLQWVSARQKAAVDREMLETVVGELIRQHHETGSHMHQDGGTGLSQVIGFDMHQDRGTGLNQVTGFDMHQDRGTGLSQVTGFDMRQDGGTGLPQESDRIMKQEDRGERDEQKDLPDRKSMGAAAAFSVREGKDVQRELAIGFDYSQNPRSEWRRYIEMWTGRVIYGNLHGRWIKRTVAGVLAVVMAMILSSIMSGLRESPEQIRYPSMPQLQQAAFQPATQQRLIMQLPTSQLQQATTEMLSGKMKGKVEQPTDISKKMPVGMRFRPIDNEALRDYLRTRNSMLAETPYFDYVMETAGRFDIHPLLLFAIAGQEQGFVPRDHPMASRMINNPYNVFGSWERYNTNLSDATEIAARTLINLSQDCPEGMSIFQWINRRYAEDDRWHVGVTQIFDKLQQISEK